MKSRKKNKKKLFGWLPVGSKVIGRDRKTGRMWSAVVGPSGRLIKKVIH